MGQDEAMAEFGMPVFAYVNDRRAQALKVLEEASELCEAAKTYVRSDGYPAFSKPGFRVAMIDELADVYQALANLRASFGVTDEELENAVRHCIESNESRGRY